MHILFRASGFPILVRHGDATCAQRMKCRANGIKQGLSFLRFCKILRTLMGYPTAMSLPQVANRVWHTRGPLTCFSTIAYQPVHRRCRPNPAVFACCFGYPVRLLMISLWPWLVLAAMTSKMLSPRTVQVRHLWRSLRGNGRGR